MPSAPRSWLAAVLIVTRSDRVAGSSGWTLGSLVAVREAFTLVRGPTSQGSRPGPGTQAGAAAPFYPAHSDAPIPAPACGWPPEKSGWTWHVVRQHVATWMLAPGIGIKDVNLQLGHSDVSTRMTAQEIPATPTSRREAW